ncbi:MAG: hypothetical protein ABIV51_14350 [Saprospiraceae bacterium]
MKRFAIQLLKFAIPFVLLFSLFLSDFPVLNYEILNSELEEKIISLKIDTSRLNIIIAGDSRAERQLMPAIFNTNTGLSTINIATTGCDLVTVVSAIKKKYADSAKLCFIISASSWQVNDGAIDHGYLSLNCFQKLSKIGKFILYKKYLSELLGMQVQLFKEFVHSVVGNRNCLRIDSNAYPELGFIGIEGRFKVQDKSSLNTLLSNHSWYKNNSNSGFRWAIFQNSLKELEKINAPCIIYQPPVSSYWKSNTENSFIDIAEMDYSRKVTMEIQKYKNIVFFDFYSNDIRELDDSMYYDYQHLNRQGAEIFSGFLAKKFMESYECR